MQGNYVVGYIWMLLAAMLTFFVVYQLFNVVTEPEVLPVYKECMRHHAHLIISDESFDYWDSFCMKEARGK